MSANAWRTKILDSNSTGVLTATRKQITSGAPILRLCLAAGMCLPAVSVAQKSPLDIADASLEDLMDIQVTSVSKKPQSLLTTPGAIYVISQDDIRQSGATNIPDLLRMVPGVEVARIDANAWAISIRGFNYRYSGKVLVLIDGRSVYSPLFAGVYWDQQNVPLENIERIEVIRGPGGTVWGANAMNGVINIITKSAADTRGVLVRAGAGSYDRAQGLVQYGGAANGGTVDYRVYGQYSMNVNSPSLAGNPGVDAGHIAQAGFRADWGLSGSDKLTVQGDISGASESQAITTLFFDQVASFQAFNDKVRFGAENLLGRWTHTFGNGSEFTTQIYFDRFRRFDQALNAVNTGDVDLQYHFHAGARNDIVAGFGYRIVDWTDTNGYEIVFGSGAERDDLFTGFVQDEIRVTNTVALTAGIKIEHNSITGYEYQPGVQLSWTPSSRQTIWASASKAIEEPSELFEESKLAVATVPIPGVGFGVVTIDGNPKSKAQRMFDYELGYRREISKSLTIDTSAFLSNYSRLVTDENEAPYFTFAPPPPHLVLPSMWGNLGKALDYGIELSAHWNVTPSWRLSPGFSYLQMDLTQDPRSTDTGFFLGQSGDSPKFQAQLRSSIKLPHNLEWDASAYYVGALRGGSSSLGPVPAYTRVDSRIGWHIGETTELSLTGQNLLTPHHLEFLDGLQVTPMETARAVVARITWRY